MDDHDTWPPMKGELLGAGFGDGPTSWDVCGVRKLRRQLRSIEAWIETLPADRQPKEREQLAELKKKIGEMTGLAL